MTGNAESTDAPSHLAKVVFIASWCHYLGVAISLVGISMIDFPGADPKTFGSQIDRVMLPAGILCAIGTIAWFVIFWHSLFVRLRYVENATVGWPLALLLLGPFAAPFYCPGNMVALRPPQDRSPVAWRQWLQRSRWFFLTLAVLVAWGSVHAYLSPEDFIYSYSWSGGYDVRVLQAQFDREAAREVLRDWKPGFEVRFRRHLRVTTFEAPKAIVTAIDGNGQGGVSIRYFDSSDGTTDNVANLSFDFEKRELVCHAAKNLFGPESANLQYEHPQ